MKKQVLFIDYENIQNVDLSSMKDTETEIKIFVGQTQHKIPFDLVMSAQTLGRSVEWVKIDGDGRNALDFHIAYYLGSLSKQPGYDSFIILSKDTGYDPLIRHINKQGITCRRINSILEFSKEKGLLGFTDERMAKVMDNLTKIAKNKRPRTRKTLTQHLSSLFQKKFDEQEIATIIDSLFVQQTLSEDNNKLTYNI